MSRTDLALVEEKSRWGRDCGKRRGRERERFKRFAKNEGEEGGGERGISSEREEGGGRGDTEKEQRRCVSACNWG